jgi:murein L,D-transpeptidase YcbB/YkuD
VATPGQAPAPAAAAAPAANPAGNENAGAAAPSTPAAATAAPSAPAPAATNVTSPASTLPPLDQQVADQLHQLPSGKFDHVLGGKTERAAIDAFYSSRSYAPIWITDGHANARAKAAMNYLAHVGDDGLDPADYAVPNFGSLTDPQQLAEAELKFSMTVVTYARHASIGRVAWSRVDANIEYDTKAPEAASVLAKLVDAKDVAAALDAYEPHAPGYLALKAKLAEIRGGQALKPAIAHGRVLKIGDQDSRVSQLREKLDVAGDGSNTYDKTLAEAVKKFQREHGLKPTGTLTAATVDGLNGPRPTHVIDIILANMERWRWMPHDLGKNHVLINLPDFTASVFHDGKRIWKTKIVIGKPDMPTPIITAMMKYITVNPIWHVPPSIINREYLPAMAEDPTVMQRMGLVVERAPSGRVVGIYQPPGDRNAEGRLRFNFPNKFLVYQHDTPDKYMFGYAKRAFSHGCMRTQDPAKYAEVLLSLVRPNDGYTKQRIEQMYGPRETNIDFPTFIPVHVTYQTAFVDHTGKLEFRDDIYGRDRELLAIMHNPAELRVADIPVERRIAASHREILQAADNLPSFGRYDGQGGPAGFFARLFGGGFGPPSPPQPPARVPRRRRMSTRNWTTYDR